MRLGIVALARSTFDLGAATTMAAAAHRVVRELDPHAVGDPTPVLGVDDLRDAARRWSDTRLDALVVVQATFADSSLVAAAAATTDAPLVLWSAPESRTGGRLRRNSLCGVNIAAYLLRRAGRSYTHLHLDPDQPGAAARLATTVEAGPLPAPPVSAPPDVVPSGAARRAVTRLRTLRVGVIGERPAGFEPCDFDPVATREVTGVAIDAIPLDDLFVAARAADPDDVDTTAAELGDRLDLAPLEGESIEPSTRLHLGLRALVAANEWDAVATRCWPECFTEFGGAACTAQAHLTDALGVPAMCEADAYGAITAALLRELAGADPFVADLVDVDPADDTAVVWHCGLAPLSMAAPSPAPRGARHPNRGLPLLNEFALRAGPVTVARLSQSRNHLRLLVGRGTLLDAPRPFAGTAGTLRFSRPVDEVLTTIMAEGLEHHYGIVHGDVHDDLLGVAALLGLAVITI